MEHGLHGFIFSIFFISHGLHGFACFFIFFMSHGLHGLLCFIAHGLHGFPWFPAAAGIAKLPIINAMAAVIPSSLFIISLLKTVKLLRPISDRTCWVGMKQNLLQTPANSFWFEFWSGIANDRFRPKAVIQITWFYRAMASIAICVITLKNIMIANNKTHFSQAFTLIRSYFLDDPFHFIGPS